MQSKELELLERKLSSKLTKAIFDYSLIEDGDTILIGLSGGKDSLALTELLGKRMRIDKPRFTLKAAHISMTNIPYQPDLKYLESFASEYNIPFIHAETSFDATTDKRKSPCFLCSWNRRKRLFDLAKTHGCNKIALGHHQDDMLRTLLMNLTFQGAFGTMPPKLQMNKFNMTIIRPLSLITETEMEEWKSLKGYSLLKKQCPYECDTYRTQMKEVMGMLEAMNPFVRQSLWNSMTNIQTNYLPNKPTQR
ncbi:ATP-binding protein [Porphyromonadaceae bacterium]